jgi:hypothetical protein
MKWDLRPIAATIKNAKKVITDFNKPVAISISGRLFLINRKKEII